MKWLVLTALACVAIGFAGGAIVSWQREPVAYPGEELRQASIELAECISRPSPIRMAMPGLEDPKEWPIVDIGCLRGGFGRPRAYAVEDWQEAVWRYGDG